MSRSLVEIHVPLVPAPGVPTAGYPFPWIDDVEEALAQGDGDGRYEVHDDGEELGDVYVFPITGDRESDLLDVAREIARLPRVPAGAYAVVADVDQEEMGTGRRVELSD